MDGEYLFEPQFDLAGDFICGMALVRKEGKYGLVRDDGTFLLNAEYAWLFVYFDSSCHSFHHEAHFEDDLRQALEAGEEVVIIAETDSEVFNFELVDGELTPIPVRYENDDPWEYY